MNEKIGLAHFWGQGDAVSYGVALLLLGMSMSSWYVMTGKLLTQWRLRRVLAVGLGSFWAAGSPGMALEWLVSCNATGIFAGLAEDAIGAARASQLRPAGGFVAGVDAGVFLERTLHQSVIVPPARVEEGLTLLASVGSTAPFVGLLGTV